MGVRGARLPVGSDEEGGGELNDCNEGCRGNLQQRSGGEENGRDADEIELGGYDGDELKVPEVWFVPARHTVMHTPTTVRQAHTSMHSCR